MKVCCQCGTENRFLFSSVRTEDCSVITVNEFNKFFVGKVAAIRSGTADASDPTFTAARPDVTLTSFSTIPVSDMFVGIMKLSDKTFAADSLSVPLLKQVTTDIVPLLTVLFNRSLTAGCLLSAFKEAFITPLKSLDASSYCPILNLSVISKLLEWLVTKQLTNYLQSADLLLSLQSGFRLSHSVETAALQMFSDILLAVDSGDVAALVLLDLSAAFDTVDHAILCRHLQVRMDWVALCWSGSSLT